MKKSLIIAFTLLCNVGTLWAQVVSTDPNAVITDEDANGNQVISIDFNTTTTETSTSTDKDVSYTDYNASFSSESKTIGLRLGYGSESSPLYFTYSMALGYGDYSSYSTTVGVGVHQHYISNKFIIMGRIFPYLGYLSYKTPEVNDKGKVTKKDKDKFTYGAMANASIGYQLWTTKKDTRGFITVGYVISAPEFETEDMFKNGEWTLGVTVAY